MSLPPSRTATNLKPYDSSSPSGSSSRRASKITVEYHKPSRQSIQEYQELLSNVNVHAAAAANYKDPFVPSRQAPPPPSPNHASKPSRGQEPSLTSVSHHKSRSSIHKPSHHSRRRSVTTAPTTIHEAESDPFSTAPSTPLEEYSSFVFPTSKDMAASSVPPTPPRPSRANTANLTDLYADPNPPPVHSTAPTPVLDQFPRESYGDPHTLSTAASSTVYSHSVAITPFSSPPGDRTGTTSRSRSGTVTAKGKKGMLGFMTDFLNSNKRPEISTPYDPVHLTHVGFNSSTGEFTGLPKEWQQLLQDSGISKSDQEKNPLAVMEIVKFYQEGGGDVWDKMGHAPAPGGSQSPPIPGTAQSAHLGVSKSVDDSFIPSVSPFLYHFSQARLLTIQSDLRCHLLKRRTLPAARRVCPGLTRQHHIVLRHLHPNLRNPTWTDRTPNEQYQNRHAVTRSSAQILPGTGALRDHRLLLKFLPENHPTLRPRISR
jgi:p21-activated kinase 1